MNHRGMVVKYGQQLEFLYFLLADLLQHPGLADVPVHRTWVGSLHNGNLDANLYAFWVLSFASMVGQHLDSELLMHLVPLLNWNEFSVNWLASQSIKSISHMLGLLGQRPDFAEMLINLAVAIRDCHNGVVPDSEDELDHLPGVNYHAIQLVLRHGFDQNPVNTTLCHCIFFHYFCLIIFYVGYRVSLLIIM